MDKDETDVPPPPPMVGDVPPEEQPRAIGSAIPPPPAAASLFARIAPKRTVRKKRSFSDCTRNRMLNSVLVAFDKEDQIKITEFCASNMKAHVVVIPYTLKSKRSELVSIPLDGSYFDLEEPALLDLHGAVRGVAGSHQLEMDPTKLLYASNNERSINSLCSLSNGVELERCLDMFFRSSLAKKRATTWALKIYCPLSNVETPLPTSKAKIGNRSSVEVGSSLARLISNKRPKKIQDILDEAARKQKRNIVSLSQLGGLPKFSKISAESLKTKLNTTIISEPAVVMVKIQDANGKCWVSRQPRTKKLSELNRYMSFHFEIEDPLYFSGDTDWDDDLTIGDVHTQSGVAMTPLEINVKNDPVFDFSGTFFGSNSSSKEIKGAKSTKVVDMTKVDSKMNVSYNAEKYEVSLALAGDSCPVCLEKYKMLDEDVVLTRCCHALHLSCLEGALINCGSKCPCCKRVLTFDDQTGARVVSIINLKNTVAERFSAWQENPVESPETADIYKLVHSLTVNEFDTGDILLAVAPGNTRKFDAVCKTLVERQQKIELENHEKTMMDLEGQMIAAVEEGDFKTVIKLEQKIKSKEKDVKYSPAKVIEPRI